MDEYAFVECYCEERGCDCRRVLIRVTPRRAPQSTLATINFGWESADFYTDWMHGDAESGREITAGCLDPLNLQSAFADEFLAVFQNQIITDSEYVARLARHYRMFKEAESADPPPVADPSPPSILTIPEILQQLQRVPEQADFAPYEAALRGATAHRKAITPELIAAIDRVSSNPDHYCLDHDDCLHLFAIYLLAQFREPRALNCFWRFFSLPGEQALDLTGDMVTEHGAAILASVCDGDFAPLLRLIHDESVNEFVRAQAIEALTVQSLWGERPREAVVADLRRLFQSLPKPGDGYVWASLVCTICDFQAPELLPEARQAFAAQVVDESIIDLRSLETEFSEINRPFSEDYLQRRAPVDAVYECSAWLCFRGPDDPASPPWDDAIEEAGGARPWAGPYNAFDSPVVELDDAPAPTPYVAPPKVGRNEPCPCGSGKKYKKCCGRS